MKSSTDSIIEADNLMSVNNTNLSPVNHGKLIFLNNERELQMTKIYRWWAFNGESISVKRQVSEQESHILT